MNNNSTIVAIATPHGMGGIGIIKISGPEAVTIATSVFRKSSETSQHLSLSYETHKLYHGYIFDPRSSFDIDEVLFVVMKKPNSYTKEDVVEIQAHSNPLILRTILEILVYKGVNLAEPGEFTKRAFLNGRLDLTQAEAVMDIINAKSLEAKDIAFSQIKGELKEHISTFRDILFKLLTLIEAGIDFPDEVNEIINYKDTAKIIHDNIITPLNKLVIHYDNAHFLRDGIKIAIIGAPNVGKSSLMNRLIGKERSIVTKVQGTTRDFVEDCLNLDGLPFIITDTAGIHKTDDLVETIGIQRACEKIEEADIILLVIDILNPHKDEKFIFENITVDDYTLKKFKEKKVITVYNKIDIVKSSNLQAEYKNIQYNAAMVSALKGNGIEKLKKKIVSTCLQMACLNKQGEEQSSILINLRHKILIQQAILTAQAAFQAFNSELSLELIAIDISETLQLLGDVSGITSKPDVIDNIFKNFCIGK